MIRSLAVAAVAFVGLSPVLAHAAPNAPVEKLTAKIPAVQLKLFAISYRSDKGTVGEMRLNDVPAIRFSGEGNTGSSSEIQGWLLPGTNRIDLTLSKIDGDEPVTITLHGLAEPAFPDDSNALLKITLKKGAAAGARAYTFELPEKQAPPAQLWKKAAVLATVGDADKKAVRELMQSFLAATKTGDVPTLKKLFSFTLEERARITYSDPKELAGMVEQMAPEMKKSFAGATISPTLEYSLVGGGRIVRVTAPGGKPPIVAKSKDGESAMPISAAKLDGTWTLVP